MSTAAADIREATTMWGNRLVTELSAVAMVAAALPVGASDYTWDGTTGFFDDSSHWSPTGGPPGFEDTALFTSPNTYTVAWWSDATGSRVNTSFTVSNGHVTMHAADSGPAEIYNYGLNGWCSINNFGWLTVGAAGQPFWLSLGEGLDIDTGGTLVITEGTVSGTFMDLGSDPGSAGAAIVEGSASVWSS